MNEAGEGASEATPGRPEDEIYKSYPPRNKYAEEILPCIQRLLDAEGSDADWKTIHTKNGVTIKRQKAVGFEKRGTANELFKGTGIINAPAFVLFDMLTCDSEIKREFVEHVETINPVERVDSDTTIVHEVYKTPTRFVSQREFCFLTHRCRVPDGRYVIASYSTTHDDAPVGKKYVRAEIITGGFVISPDPNGDPMKCQATYVIHQDMNGSIPGFICTMIAKEVPMTVNDIRQWIDSKHIDYANYTPLSM